MKVLNLVLLVAISSLTVVLTSWVCFEIFTKFYKKPSSCKPVTIWDLTRNLNESVAYRVQNDFAPNGTIYQGAVVNIAWKLEGDGFMVFNCHKPSGSTCDSYKMRIEANGTFRTGRIEKYGRDPVEEMEQYTFGVEEDGNSYYICDPQKRFLSRFKLIPTDRSSAQSSSGETCSADYGNRLDQSTGGCDIFRLKQNTHGVIPGDLEAKVRIRLSSVNSGAAQGGVKNSSVGFSKRILFTSIVVVMLAVIGIVMVSKKLNMWINKAPVVAPVQNQEQIALG